MFAWESDLRRDFHRFFGALGARGHRTVYVEPAIPWGTRAPPPVRKARDNPAVTLLTPRTVRGQSLRPVAALNAALHRRAIRRAWATLDIPEPDVVIVNAPWRGFFWDVFPGALRVYRNYDFVPRGELHDVADRAELILTTSRRYARDGTFPTERTRYLAQTCDDLSGLAEARRARGEPDPRVVGTMGSFGPTMGLELLARVVTLADGFRFLFQGKFGEGARTRGEVLAMLGQPRVELIERGDSAAGPIEDFLCRIRVGLLPVAIQERTLYAAPDKLFAFLRAGLPIVATDFSPETLEPFRELAGFTVARDAEAFARALPDALEAGQDPAVVRGLIEAASPHLAATVAGRFETIVEERLSGPRG